MTKKCGIYCYENKINGKRYIGQSIDLDRRHRKMDYKNSTMFTATVAKHGLDNFDYYILELCSPDELDDREIFWIGEYQTFPPSLGYGYNLTTGGGHYEFTDEVRAKLSESHSGEKHWCFGKKGELNPLYGKPKSPEHRQKISEGKKGENHPLFGKHLPEDWANKIKESMMGKQNTLGQKNQPNASSSFYGVQKRPNRPSWKAVLKYMNKTIYIGSSKDEETAARMYDAYVREHNLPHPLNFTEGE